MENFENKVNYAWPITSVLAGMYQYFLLEIRTYKEYLAGKRIVIFGAGIRGCTLLLMLEEEGFSDIVFCDNNLDKQKGRINRYPIYSLQKTLQYSNPQVFILPTENGGSIRDQLLGLNLIENNDFFYWDFKLYDDYMKEFERPVQNYVLVMGDCAFSHVSIGDDNKETLSEMIKNKFGEDGSKILEMHGMGQRAYYNIVNVLIEKGECPKLLLLQVVPEVLASKAHIMPRTQHAELINKILNSVSYPDNELIEYSHLTKERFERFQVESYASYNGSNSEDSAKLYMKMNYMFTLKETAENVEYLKKTITLMNSKGIPVVLYIPPVNYIQGNIYWGEDFIIMYKKIFEDLWCFLENLEFSILDASFLLANEDFAMIKTIDETANYRGRLKLLDFFEKSGVF